MKYALIFLTDGRLECAARTLESADEQIGLNGFDQIVAVNDKPGVEYQTKLEGLLKPHTVTWRFPKREKRGFGGAIREAWKAVDPSMDFVFHLEDDFELQRTVPIEQMGEALLEYPRVMQFALRRQAWSPEEIEAGGVVERNPDAYHDVTDPRFGSWMEHRLFFTTNPSLYRSSLIDVGWPDGELSEGRFTHKVIAQDPNRVFAYWGERTDMPWVHHIGEVRAGTGY